MSPTFRRLTVLCAALLVAVLGTGCSKKHNTKIPPYAPITHEDSDDLVQQAAMMTSIDNGGWLVDVLGTMESAPLPSVPLPSLSQRVMGLSLNPRSPVRVNRDTTISRAAMNYSIHYYYTTTAGDSIGAWTVADTVSQVDAHVTAIGSIAATGFNASYFRHIGDPVTGAGFQAGSDTVQFSGSGDDTLFTTFTPKLRTGTKYFASAGFLDYELTVLRDPRVNVLPVTGTATYFLFGDLLHTANPDDISTTLEATVIFNFNGTQTVTVDVIDELYRDTPLYHYSVNLRTGDFSRLP